MQFSFSLSSTKKLVLMYNSPR